MTLVPVENVPPMLFGSPFRSKRTRTFGIAALLGADEEGADLGAVVWSTREFVETTLGLADTEAELIGPDRRRRCLPAPDCTSTVRVFETPPAVPTMSSDPAVAGAV